MDDYMITETHTPIDVSISEEFQPFELPIIALPTFSVLYEEFPLVANLSMVDNLHIMLVFSNPVTGPDSLSTNAILITVVQGGVSEIWTPISVLRATVNAYIIELPYPIGASGWTVSANYLSDEAELTNSFDGAYVPDLSVGFIS